MIRFHRGHSVIEWIYLPTSTWTFFILNVDKIRYCMDHLPTHPPTSSFPRSYWTIPYHRYLRQGFDSKSVFLFSEMDFHLRRKIRQVSIIRPNSLCFLLPPALSKKTMAAPQLTMLVFKFSFQFISQMINTTLDSVWKFLKAYETWLEVALLN